MASRGFCVQRKISRGTPQVLDHILGCHVGAESRPKHTVVPPCPVNIESRSRLTRTKQIIAEDCAFKVSRASCVIRFRAKLCFQLSSTRTRYKGPRRLYYVFSLHLFVKNVFLRQPNCSRYNTVAQTGLTANGQPAEPKLVRT